MSRFGALRVAKLLIVLGLWSLPVLAQTPARLPAGAAAMVVSAVQEQKAGAASNASEYAGAESCKTCHEDIYNGWEKSPHWKQTYKEGGIAKHGCEDCHGAAAGHVADPADTSKLFLFEKASVKEIDARCLGCHAGGTQHMNAINSEHARNEVSCIACHSPHHSKDSDFMLVKSQPELCYSCHLAKKAEFDMPFHHRVNEGLLQCTDCHNPHGTVKPKQVRTSSSQDQVCFTCHTDKQGPFVFEHQPVKIDGCQSCHLVHGGPNPHMLKLSNVNLLCLQCHTQSSFSGAPGAPSFHNQASFFQSCVLCHSQVHGSNFDPTFFK
jgi:DmsE family decaheme c-type cytochrome